jgi:hypothetical protein
MNLLRSFLAILFAIVIVNPACCCTGQPTPKEAVHGCCGGKKEKYAPVPHDCACRAKEPRLIEDPPALPGFTVIELPPLYPAAETRALPLPVATSIPALDIHLDTGPPRQRLMLLQRLLI